jgi:Major capsid protein Gp23
MSDVMNLISEAGSAHKVITEEARKLAGKWEKSGLLEGLQSYDKQSMAVMLENQASQLLQETSYTNLAGTAGEQWSGVALPLVRKVFGSIASKNFVSVQPMNLPSGLVFYMDFKYGTTNGGQTSGTSLYGDRLASAYSSFGNQDTGGLYGAGRFGYSINDATKTGLTITTASVAFSDVNFNQDYVATGSYRKFSVTGSATNFTNPDFLSVRTWIPSGSGVDFAANVVPEFTKFDVATGNVVFIVATTANAVLNSVTYNKQPVDTARGDFEDTTGSDIGIPEINLELKSETIVAKTRKLKAIWSPELAQDLNAYHSIDAEAELTAMLSDYISAEIDLEILDMLIQAAPSITTEYWSAEIGSVYNSTTGAFAASSFSGTAWTNMTWFQTLGQKMQKVSNKIHQLTMRGGANFAVVSPTVATILETIPGFMAGTDGDKMEFAGGVTKIGSFQNRYTIYKNPYMKENVMLLGFRGNNFLETGAVYAPYIPLIMTPLVYDPTNFTPRRGVMTRYAKKVVRPEFFGKILIDKLNLV